MDPQVPPDCAKSPLVAKEIVVDPVPVFFTVAGLLALVTPTATEPNASFVGVTVIFTVAAAPVPERLTTCGEFEAVSVIVIEPVRVPAAVGVNVTLIAQFAPAFNVVGQVFVSPKSPLGAIVIVVLPPPVLVTMIGWLALVVPTVCEANVKLVGLGVINGTVDW